jgi:hypothetical protein
MQTRRSSNGPSHGDSDRRKHAGARSAGALARFLHGFAYALLVALVALVAASVAPLASAAPVPGLYEGTVPGELTEAGRAAAAEEALRQVVVRVTGRRGADRDPALQALYANATRYVQTVRPLAGGFVTVGFDGDAVDGALIQAGLPLWAGERPLTLVVLVLERPGQPRVLAGGVDAEEKRAVDRAAQLRGLPLAWPGPVDAATAAQRIDDVLAGRADALRDFAARYEAAGVLYGRATPQGTQWSWSLPSGTGSVSGAATDGVHAVADRYAAALASGQSGVIALLPVVVTGVRTAVDYAAAANALGALPNVLAVQFESGAGERLTFRVNYRGDPETLRRAVSAGGRLAPQGDDPRSLTFVLQP